MEYHTNKVLKIFTVISLIALIVFILLDAKSESSSFKIWKYILCFIVIILTSVISILRIKK